MQVMTHDKLKMFSKVFVNKYNMRDLLKKNDMRDAELDNSNFYIHFGRVKVTEILSVTANIKTNKKSWHNLCQTINSLEKNQEGKFNNLSRRHCCKWSTRIFQYFR